MRARAKGGYLAISLSSFVLAGSCGYVPMQILQGRTIQRFLCPAGRSRRPVTRLRLYRALRNESDVTRNTPGRSRGEELTLWRVFRD